MGLSLKYWKFHKKKAAVLFFAILAGTMAMTVGIFIARSQSQTFLENCLDERGAYDLIVQEADGEQLDIIREHPDIEGYGIILNGGTCGSSRDNAVFFGAMQDKNAERLFHYAPERDGRYPEASGEICGYKSAFESLGTAGVKGNTIELSVYDNEGGFAGKKKFTIVGVLNDQRGGYQDTIRTMTDHGDIRDKADFPLLFMHMDDIPEGYTMTAMLECRLDSVIYKVANSLRDAGIATIEDGRTNAFDKAIGGGTGGVSHETLEELFRKAHLTDKDFYSSFMIPVFLGIIIAISFISIYGVMSGIVSDRKKQMGLLRCLGASVKSVRRMMLCEISVFCIAGTAAGYAVGIFLYLLYLWIVNAFFGIHIYSTFNVHLIAAVSSLDPYVLPWALGLLFSSAAAAVPLLKGMKNSPNEMLFPEKTEEIKISRKPAAGSPLAKTLNSNRGGMAGVFFIVLAVGWVFIFGTLFIMGKSDYDNLWPIQRLEELGGLDADYSISKDFNETMVGNTDFNRHGEGIPEEKMELIRESEDVALAGGVTELPGLKLLFHDKGPEGSLGDELKKLNIENNFSEERAEIYRELLEKSREKQGYEKDDMLYRLPSAAVDNDILDMIEECLVSGEADREGLLNGSKILIAEYPGKEMENPFAVGDRLTLTQAVNSDRPYAEDADLSSANIPEDWEPDFYYDYTDGALTGVRGFAFGKNVSFDVEICGVVRIEDTFLENLLYTDTFVYNDRENPTGHVCPGYGILCSTEAVKAWGLPDVCRTRVFVNLKKGADRDRFETLWYPIVGMAGKSVAAYSKTRIKNMMSNTLASNMAVFTALSLLIVIAGSFGMVNAYNLAVGRNMKNLQIMRAIGISRKQLSLAYCLRALVQPFIAAVTALIPVWVFDRVARYAYHYAFDLGHNSAEMTEEGKMILCWQVRFPWYIKLWEQPVFMVMAVGFLLLSAVNAAAVLFPVIKMRKLDIVAGIREEQI